MKAPTRVTLLISFIFLFTVTAAATDLTVTNTNDSGPGSLREAIFNANAGSGTQVINFNIPGSGPFVISPASPLPTITAPVTIDGTTQPGFSGKPIIELDGSGAGDADGLVITAGGSTVRGLAIFSFSKTGITLQGNGGNVIQDNYIGTDSTGEVPFGNGLQGIFISDAPNNIIGERNIISGNGSDGIAIVGSGSHDNQVIGNFIGVDASGTTGLGNGTNGVFIGDGSGFNPPVPGAPSGTLIGSTTPSAHNVISGNNGDGILISGNGAAMETLVPINFIGTDASGTGPLGNGGDGIEIISASNNLIGAPSITSEGNTIAFNLGAGVNIRSGNGDPIWLNSIFSNGRGGIVLLAGANNNQAAPVITSIINSGNGTTIQGTAQSSPNTPLDIRFFSGTNCGDAQNPLGETTATTDANGRTSFTFTTPTPLNNGTPVTATATDSNSNTSSFAVCSPVGLPLVRGLNPGTGPEAGGAQITITGGNFTAAGAGTTIVLFGTIQATNVMVVNDNTITATAPAGLGQVAVTVQNGNGTSNADQVFTYQPPPLANPEPAIMGTGGDGNLAVVFPRPDLNLPTPTQNVVTGLPSGAAPQGVSYFGSDRALISDFANSHIFVVQVSTNSLLATINTSGTYDGTGTIAVAPNLEFALANGNSPTLAVIHAPFNASSAITTVTLPGQIKDFQTQAIVFSAAGRAFVYNTAGISVLDPPYDTVAFTIKEPNNKSRAIAITPDGNTLLVTNDAGDTVDIFTAPFSAASMPVTLPINGPKGLDGINITPDGQTALVVEAFIPQAFAISAPFSSTSTVQRLPLAPAVVAAGSGFEDVGISADGQFAIFTGNSIYGAPAAFIRAPFTTSGARSFAVPIAGGGRGAGSVRFEPPGLAPGLTISKSAPASVASGSNLTYTITYANTGTADASGIIVSDPLPAGTTFVSASNGGTLNNGVVTWNIGAVPAGTTNQTLSLTVNVTAAGGSTVTNSNYTIAASGVSPIPGPPVSTSVTTATQFSISGQVTNAGGTALNNVLITLSGSTSATTTTDTNGNYSFANLTAGGNYTITPTKSGFTFTPASETFNNLTANQAFNFTASPLPSTLQFSSSNYSAGASDDFIQIIVTRLNDTSQAASVDYATSDGTATQKSDYIAASGTLQFAPGDTSKSFTVLIIHNGLGKGAVTANLTLSTPLNADLGMPDSAALTIVQSSIPSATNPVDDPIFYVRQHYLDFLNREPDQAGLNFWTGQITSCNGDAGCIDVKRQNVSAAYFLSREFQETGFFVIKVQRAAFGHLSQDATKRITYQQFLTDSQQVGNGFIDGQPNADAILDQNKTAYVQAVVTSANFQAQYPNTLSASAYVDALFTTAQVTPTSAERQTAITAFGSGDVAGRAAALRKVAESDSMKNAEFNPAFVLLQYFGYLRRDPDDAGYQFWLKKLTSANGDYIGSQMVRSFIVSTEYRQRFGKP